MALCAFLLLGGPALADSGDGPVTIASHPQIAVVSIARYAPPLLGGSRLASAPPTGLDQGGVTLGIETGNGSVTIARASDLVGAPVDLISYARMRAAMAARARALGSGQLPAGSPLARATLTSIFGMRWHPLLGGYRPHMGVDLAAPAGTPIFAPSDGVVGRANWTGGYGLLVALEHGKGVESRYGHMSRISVSAGQQVRKGQVIGYVGSTGLSTGPHLHYEVRVDGRPVNPGLGRASR